MSCFSSALLAAFSAFASFFNSAPETFSLLSAVPSGPVGSAVGFLEFGSPFIFGLEDSEGDCAGTVVSAEVLSAGGASEGAIVRLTNLGSVCVWESASGWFCGLSMSD